MSSREWLARGRENSHTASASGPTLVTPSRRFTCGVRVAIVLAVVFYSRLVVVNLYDPARDLPAVAVVLLALAVGVALVALVETWRWAGRSRFSTSPSEPLDAGLAPEQKKTVRRMTYGRGPDVAALRPLAAVRARAQQQSLGLSPALLALLTLSNLSQNSLGNAGLILGAVLLLLNAGGLGWALWMGHRARTLHAHLPTSSEPAEAGQHRQV